jgi:MerR family mercuric resistance operon transcriptional regulator
MPVPAACGSAFRSYDEQHLDQLLFIRRAQSAGFTLDEIAELLKLDRTEGRDRVRHLALERLEALEQKIEDLRRAQAALRPLVESCRTRDRGPCPIIEAFACTEAHAARA